jgi:hypothetical protein
MASSTSSSTVELAGVLRSLMRFLAGDRLRADRREDAVPMVLYRPVGLVEHLNPARLEQLISSLDSSSPRGLWDRQLEVA